MRPAFRSRTAAICWAGGLFFLLTLPILLPLAGLPPRVEAYKTVGTNAGTIGSVLRDLDSRDTKTGVVFLGSSLVEAGIDRTLLEQNLDRQEKRPVTVALLALNWPGLDQEYFLLRDYLERRKVSLIVWNLPEPHSRAYDSPHVQAYRWIRYGEYGDSLWDLPLQYRLSIYGEMVLGAPRQLLSRLRPNLEGQEGMQVETALQRSGYSGKAFVPDDAPMAGTARLLPLNAEEVQVTGPAPGPYQMHFARRSAALAKEHNCTIVLLHVPTDTEAGDTRVPELADWKPLGVNGIIAIPSTQLFPGFDRTRVMHFYRDSHLNQNGSQVFTRSILPAVREAYDQANRD